MTSRIRETMRRARRDIHSERAVAALYIATTGATARPCTVRTWLKTENNMVGSVSEFSGAQRAEPEDRLRFDLSEISFIRNNAIVSVEAGEAYRVDHVYPPYRGYQTARVVRLNAAEAANLPVPTDD